MTMTLGLMQGREQQAEFKGQGDSQVLGPKTRFRDVSSQMTLRARLGFSCGCVNLGWDEITYKIRSRRSGAGTPGSPRRSGITTLATEGETSHVPPARGPSWNRKADS